MMRQARKSSEFSGITVARAHDGVSGASVERTFPAGFRIVRRVATMETGGSIAGRVVSHFLGTAQRFPQIRGFRGSEAAAAGTILFKATRLRPNLSERLCR
jgi:hypothetical protein